MKKLTYSLIAALLVFGCSVKKTEPEHDHAGHDHSEEAHDDHHEQDEVSITEEQAKSINLQLGSITTMKLSEVIETNGALELAPQNIADVHVLIGGIVDNIRVIEGSKITKGQILASIKHPDIIKLQEDLINQNAQLNYAENEYNRQKTLYEEKVGSGKEFQKIKAEYEGLKALTDALKAKVKMLGMDPEAVVEGKIAEMIHVRSPLNGKVSVIQTNIGEFVSTDKRLFQIVDNKHIHAAFRVYENDILKVSEGQKITVSSPAFGNQVFTANIYAISPAFEENPKNVHIHADLEKHDDRLIPGMYISGKIKVDSIARNVVPRAAVVSENDKKYIFILDNNEVLEHPELEHLHEIHLRRIEVQTGIEEADWIEILVPTTFPEHVQIALSGAYYLQAEIGKGETGHSH